MDIFFIIVTIIVSIPVFIFTFEVMFALFPQRKMQNLKNENRPTITVLVPAHNESESIRNTLVSINAQLVENDRLLVVADNCTDDTASVAIEHGAEVLERTDTIKRGKGYALDYGIRHLESNPTDIVIVIDADCTLDEGALELLAKMAMVKNRPVQSLNIMKYKKPELKQRIAEFAWLVKNYIRPRGLYNIGMPCQLMGTGMAFPWNIIIDADLATSNIVEDMKMGLDMTGFGHAPIFCPYAGVISTFPETTSAEQSQKKRWEHGHLSILISVIPPSLLRAIKQRSMNTFVMSLDLIVPPLALLALLIGLVLLSALIYALATESYIPLIISVITSIMFTVGVVLSWLLWGRKIVSLTDLLMVPVYIMGKIPLYVTYLFKRQKEWIRTDRD